MAQSDEEKWLQYAEEYGSPLEDQNKVVVVEEEDIDETMSIPGLQYNIDPTTSTRATPLRYVQLHLSSLFRKISAMLQTVTNAVSDLAQIKTETNAAATNANNKALLANTAAQNADNKASTAKSQGNDAESKGNFAKTQGDYAKAWNDHPPYIGNDNYWYLYNTTTHAYVRAAYAKGNDLDYSTMTPEEVQMLIDNIKSDLIVASVETCESIIDELT